jgi:Ca2+-binding RTX toxin-like protein
VVGFNSNNATPAAVSTLLDHIAYADNSDDPSTAVRTLTFTAVDGGGTTGPGIATATIHDVAVNDPPVLGGDLAITVPEGGIVAVTTADLTASDPDNTAAQLVYTVTAASHGIVELNGAATASFTQQDLAGNLVSFQHDGGEAGGSFTVSLTDGIAAAQFATVDATVNPHVNDPPTITSDGGGDTATLSVPEHSTAVTTVTATDPDSPNLTFSIAGGDDQSDFLINPTTGNLSFAIDPDFATPSDADHNNSYIVDVRVSDGTLFDDQVLTVDVTQIPGVHLVGDDTGNTLTGTEGDDTLIGAGGNDIIHGLGGNDFLEGDAGADTIDGGNGFDLASWLPETSGLTLDFTNQANNAGSAAGDTVTNVEAFYLTNSADHFTGADSFAFVYGFGGDDTITGSSVSDIIDGGPGADTIDGGGGFDYVSYYSSANPVTLDLANPANNTGDAHGDVITNAEAYILTSHDDTFVGTNSGQNIVFGYEGNDTLTGGFNANNWFFGGDGDDRMVGGGVQDLYVGGNGADTIVPVTPTPMAGSSVLGFTPGQDQIEISRSAFGLSDSYALTSGSTFVSGSTPLENTAAPTFVYYSDLGILYFDPDGSSAHAATLLMQFDTHPALAPTDFHLVV